MDGWNISDMCGILWFWNISYSLERKLLWVFIIECILFIFSGKKCCLSYCHCCISLGFFSKHAFQLEEQHISFLNYRKDFCSVLFCVQLLLFQYWNNLTREYGWIFLLLHWAAADTVIRAVIWVSCSVRGWMLFFFFIHIQVSAMCFLQIA